MYSDDPVIPLDSLLAPIPGANPAGGDLSYTVWSDLQDKRREEDRNGKPEPIPWNEIISTASEALKGKTKDLRIAFYMTEALVKEFGFAGLRDGLRLLRGLMEQDSLWDRLYPVARNGSLKPRANALRLNDKLDLAVKQTPLTSTIVGESYCYLQWLESEQFKIPENIEELGSNEKDQVEALKQRAAGENKITSVQWRGAARATSRELFLQTSSLLDESMAELAALERVMKARFTYIRPGFEGLKEALDTALAAETPDRDALQHALKTARAALEDADGLDRFNEDMTRLLNEEAIDLKVLKRLSARLFVREIPPVDGLKQTIGAVSNLLRELMQGEASTEPAPPLAQLEEAGKSSPSPVPRPRELPSPPSIGNRQEALARLAEVLAYFRQTEPYNPASSLIERAIRWGNLSLEQWLPRVIGNEDLLRGLRERLGIGPNAQTPDEAQEEAPVAATSNGIGNRTEALSRLSEVAAYFRATERHNPAICLVERSIAWSDLSLEQWLAQVIENEDALRHLREQLGIKSEKQA